MRKITTYLLFFLFVFVSANNIYGEDEKEKSNNKEEKNVIEQNDSAYEKLEVFATVLRYIESDYVDKVDTEKIIYHAIDGMLDALDPHSMFFPPERYQRMKEDTSGKFVGVGIEITKKDDFLTIIAPIEGSPAFAAGILAGDKIVKIDNKDISKMSLFEAVDLLKGKRGSSVTLTIRREGLTDDRNFVLKRDIVRKMSVTASIVDSNIGYIHISSFQDQTSKEVQIEIEKMLKQSVEAFVIDLRDNPGGLLDESVKVSNLFIKEGTIVTIKERKGGETVRVAEPNKMVCSLPIIIIINEGSASASEIVAGALQDHSRAMIIGTKSFGKGTVQRVVELADGSGLKLTIARYLTPKGRFIQNLGITPDIVVEEYPKKKKYSEKEYQEIVDLIKSRGVLPTDKVLGRAVELIRASKIIKSE